MLFLSVKIKTIQETDGCGKEARFDVRIPPSSDLAFSYRKKIMRGV
jgi:hypothetical protein